MDSKKYYRKVLIKRKLTGLRWYNKIKENGENEWIFESSKEKRESNFDSKFFWTLLYLFPSIWILFLIFTALTLKILWMNLCFFSVVIGVINAYGFFQCDRGNLKRTIK